MKLGRIRESSSESAVGTLFILKKDGSKRLCMDYRPVNKETVGDENKAPLQDVNRDRFRGAKYFTRFDMEDGYYRLRIREGDEKHTAFITEFGLYEWVVVCFGLKNAPAVFGRYMTHVLKEFIGDFVVVYFDDIVIYSKTLEEHREHVKEVLRKIKEEKITFKIKKCEFEVPKTEYLGHMMSGETAEMLDEKVKHILEWPKPATLKHIE
jgi:Reverse transcriptase (RNA-dependent DNA polymerase)